MRVVHRAGRFFLGTLLASSLVPGLAFAGATTNATTWYLHSTTASSAFGTTGPTAEFSSSSDLVPGSPASKSTALSMDESVGTSQHTIAGTETSTTAGNIWMGTFLSPKLAAQTISAGTTFRFELGLAESSTAANMIARIHIYQWREGAGYVASLIDNVAATACGAEPGAANSERSEVCITAGTASDATIADGDQLAIEVWVNANNTSATSYTTTLYYDGNGFIESGAASHVITSAMTQLGISQTVILQSATTNTNKWYFRSTSASSAFSTAGPTTAQSASSDLVPASPAGKSTALAMTDDTGTSQTTVVGTETSTTAGSIWYRTFLTPLLAAQTISAGTTFRVELGLAESNTGANMIPRIHIYQWREGTGHVASLIDNVPSTACGVEPGAANSERSEVCITAGTGSDITLQDGDQIAIEVWVNANNTVATSYNGTLYFEGTGFIGNGAASHAITSALSNLSSSQTLTFSTIVPAAPTVATSFAASGATTATLYGAIQDAGSSDATEHGFAYSTSAGLTSGVSTTTLGGFTGAGNFSEGITGLANDTTYYFRAYATNPVGTGFGTIRSFTTGNATVVRTMRLFQGYTLKMRGGKMILYQK